MIHKDELEFLFVAKRQFEENPEWTTYRDEDNRFIALKRHGSDIELLKIERKVAWFTDVIDSKEDK